MATKKPTTKVATQSAPVEGAQTAAQPQQPAYAQPYQVAYQNPNKGKAQFLTFEYAFAMGSLVLSALLIVSILPALFGGWSGTGSAVAHSGTAWLFGLFDLNVVTSGTGLVATGVAAVTLAVVALVGFGRVSRTIPERDGYTSRIAYKAVTYGGLAALVVAALALVAKLVGILISSLMFIGVSGAGKLYKLLYLVEFLPYLLGLGLVVALIVLVTKIVKGSNKSKIASYIAMGAATTVLVASAITVAVQVRDTSPSSLNGYGDYRNNITDIDLPRYNLDY